MPIKSNYDRVIITLAYDQPYIYLLWYGNYSPREITNTGEFSKGFENVEFRQVDWKEDKNFTRTLLIGTPDEIPQSEAIWSINFLDGTPAFLAAESQVQ
jgi:hypothetical protein